MRGSGGFTYVEVLLATVLVAVALVPALQALQLGIRGAGAEEERSADRFRLLEKMEEVLVEPFGNLEVKAGAPAAPSAYSDPAGTPGRRLVFLAPYDGDDDDGDGDPFTGGDAGLLWVRVESEKSGVHLETLVGRY